MSAVHLAHEHYDLKLSIWISPQSIDLIIYHVKGRRMAVRIEIEK